MTVRFPVLSTDEVEELLAADAPVAVGVSGGKDSTSCAFATMEHLDRIGHAGPRVLVHSDLGTTEWRDSLPVCERLADRLGVELIVVRREKGDMMDRWEQRWSDNCRRYADLACVKLILPWSTPEMRFCTSEMKVDVICRALVRRFEGQRIINASGIRRQESPKRAKAPISKAQPKLASVTRRTSGFDWHPILDFDLADVYELHRLRDFPLHEAYTVYGASRLSCAYCIMSKESDLVAASTCADNVEIGRRMVDLETVSTFAFHGDRWLGDVIANVLRADQAQALLLAKERAEVREIEESRIPEHLLYAKGWPLCVPTKSEAEMLASVRARVSTAMGLEVRYTDGPSLLRRYEELFEEKQRRAS